MTKKISWGLFGLLSISIGLYPLIYFLTDGNFGILSSKSEALLADTIWNMGFYGHITFGGIALAVGWVQFSKKLRKRNMNLHRKVGFLYIVSVLISSICGLYIGFHATGGWVAKVGFITLGIFWFVITLMALKTVKNKEIRLHEKLMIYSYAACFGAVTLRIWLPILVPLMDGFIPAYRIVAWLSWVPNLIVAYFINERITNNITKSKLQRSGI